MIGFITKPARDTKMFDVKERVLGKSKRIITKETHKDYEHKEQLNMLLKTIHQCDMPMHLKIIMRSRVWGLDPKKFDPLTPEQIAYINIGRKRTPTISEITQIEEYERQGKFHCQQLLLSKNAQDIVSGFNKNEGKNKNELFSKTTFERKSFSI